VTTEERTEVRVQPGGSGTARVETGVSVLDHLVGLLARHGGFDISLAVAPGAAEDEIAVAGRALGAAFAEPLRAEGARGHGSFAVPADEALAHVALEASGRPLVVSNVDLTEARVAGLGSDLAAAFLRELAEGAGLTLHVRLMEGRDTQHVLDAIFKALGAALAQACGRRE
jgi:imidazoleglycerol-phosphate dehydratase